MANLPYLRPREETTPPPRNSFKDYAPGFLHVDGKYLPQMQNEDARTDLFVAIDRVTRRVYLERLPNNSASAACGFLERTLKAFAGKVSKLLTDNGKEFTDRFCATGERAPTGQHPFDQSCTTHASEHRLIKPRHPQTNGMVERLNGRIRAVLATIRFCSSEHLAATLTRDAAVYHHRIPQRNLGHFTPTEGLGRWYDQQPDLLHTDPHNLPGPNNYLFVTERLLAALSDIEQLGDLSSRARAAVLQNKYFLADDFDDPRFRLDWIMLQMLAPTSALVREFVILEQRKLMDGHGSRVIPSRH